MKKKLFALIALMLVCAMMTGCVSTEGLKKVGIEARKDIATFFGKRIFLEMFVKVEANWRNRENKLRSFGYME